MKRFYAATLLFTSMAAMAVSPDTIKQPETYGNTFVSDTANIIDANNEKELDDALVKYYQTTGIQVAVVTTPDTDGSDSPRTFANKLFERLELGDPKLDNGLLMLLSIGDKRIEFETGYGLEGLIPDVTQYRIQQKYMIPFFKEGDYQQGLLDGTYATMLELDKAVKREAAINTENAGAGTLGLLADNEQTIEATAPQNSNKGLTLFGFLLLGLATLALAIFSFVLARLNKKSQSSLKESQNFISEWERDAATKKSYSPTRACDYCDDATIARTRPLNLPALSAINQARYLSRYEKALLAHNLADIALINCPKCQYVNTEIFFSDNLQQCQHCSEKSRYSFGFSEFLLVNQFNTYTDTLDRTQPLQEMVFKSVKLGWKKNTHARNNITYCFLCDDIKEERGQDYIERAPVKPKPAPKRAREPEREPRHVTTKKPTSSSSSWTGFGSSSIKSSSSRSTTSKKRSKPIHRKRGGKSGGGGAGSGW